MQQKIDDVRIRTIEEVISPNQLLKEIPVDQNEKDLVFSSRKRISKILSKSDPKLLVIVGPCSIHDPKAAIEYGQKLQTEALNYKDTLEIVMRVYFEKPRTTIGWKGLINDPDLDGSNNINKGLKTARQLLADLLEIGLPTATEFLDPITPQYIGDLISWGAIGARTTESQIHRQLASGLSSPIGFKNGTDGAIQVAVDAITSASHSHRFLSVTKMGTSAIVSTSGNSDCHVIHRGGTDGPNFSSTHINQTAEVLQSNNIKTGIMVDLSHANSDKNFENQVIAANSVCKQITEGNKDIVGIMIESNLVEGNQSLSSLESELNYGQSVTDACLGWSDTPSLLSKISDSVQARLNQD